jgi:hypothetical protein
MKQSSMDVKAMAFGVGLLLAALSAGAQDPLQAVLIGQRVNASYPGSPILICQYRGPDARYEIVTSEKSCARYLKLSELS